jgi:alginate O-acetyltransferase complex protein AlgI
VAWGLYHGVFLVVERLGLATWLANRPRPISHAYVLMVVLVGWVIFRADSLTTSAHVLTAMAGRGPAVPGPYSAAAFLTADVVGALVAGAICSTPLLKRIGARCEAAMASSSARPAAAIGYGLAAVVLPAAVLALAVLRIAAGSYDPFIYFRF